MQPSIINHDNDRVILNMKKGLEIHIFIENSRYIYFYCSFPYESFCHFARTPKLNLVSLCQQHFPIRKSCLGYYYGLTFFNQSHAISLLL